MALTKRQIQTGTPFSIIGVIGVFKYDGIGSILKLNHHSKWFKYQPAQGFSDTYFFMHLDLFGTVQLLKIAYSFLSEENDNLTAE